MSETDEAKEPKNSEDKKDGISKVTIAIIIAIAIILGVIIYHTLTPSGDGVQGEPIVMDSDPKPLIAESDTTSSTIDDEGTPEIISYEEGHVDGSFVNVNDPIFLVVGSFEKKESALEVSKKYSDLGLQPTVQDLDSDGLNRILIKSFTYKEVSQAISERKELMAQHPGLMEGLWIYNRSITKQATAERYKRGIKGTKVETSVAGKIDLNDNIFIFVGSFDSVEKAHKVAAELKTKGLEAMVIATGAEQINRVLIKTYNSISKAEQYKMELSDKHPELASQIEIWDKFNN